MCEGSHITGRFGILLFKSIAIFHIGTYLYLDLPVIEKPLCIAPILVIPAVLILSRAPIHKDKSGLIGFLMRTGVSVPLIASAISCTENGFTVVLAPIHRISIPYFNANSMCDVFATSTVNCTPNSSLISAIHFNASSPLPSNVPGLVLGFHTPALIRFIP